VDRRSTRAKLESMLGLKPWTQDSRIGTCIFHRDSLTANMRLARLWSRTPTAEYSLRWLPASRRLH